MAVTSPRDVGLPEAVRACLFDLDGVLTRTATVHEAAWAETFDAVVQERGLPPFTDEDYVRYVDGKRRPDGVRDFLASRGITLPEGDPDDGPDAVTVHGVGARKNAVLLRRIRDDGVEVFDDAVTYVRAARAAGLRTAVVSSSANTRLVLDVTGLDDLFEQVVDGADVARLGLRGKPAPDGFVQGARALGLEPPAAAVFEDALSGVAAGRAGGFGLVVGVDRLGPGDADDVGPCGHGEQLREHGADVVVTDLTALLATR